MLEAPAWHLQHSLSRFSWLLPLVSGLKRSTQPSNGSSHNSVLLLCFCVTICYLHLCSSLFSKRKAEHAVYLCWENCMSAGSCPHCSGGSRNQKRGVPRVGHNTVRSCARGTRSIVTYYCELEKGGSVEPSEPPWICHCIVYPEPFECWVLLGCVFVLMELMEGLTC